MNINLGLNKDIDKARKIIYDSFSEKNIKIEEKHYISRCYFDISPIGYRSNKGFYNKVINLILDLVLEIYSDDVINRYINDNYKNFGIADKKELSEISQKILLDRENFTVEKQYITNEIKRYLQDVSMISIDGFILFRLKELNVFVSLAVDKGIEEFTAKREYKEFISVLKYFVDVQESEYRLINILMDDNDYTLLDEEENEIDKSYFEYIIYQIDEEGTTKDDLLISILIILAPETLIIHLNDKTKNSDIMKVISDVFEDSVYFCLGCEKCKERIKINNTK